MTTPTHQATAVAAPRTPEQILASLLDPAQAAVLRRCAVPRWLDATLLEALAAEIPGGPEALATLLRTPLLESLPRPEDAYRVDDVLRTNELQAWWTGAESYGTAPRDLVAFSEQLVRHYEDRRPDPVEALYHRFAVDPAAAMPRFEELYEQADKAFDLPRCQDLLDVLGGIAVDVPDRFLRVPPDVAELHNDYARYLDARGIWIDDWYRTRPFLEPEQGREPFTSLLEPDGPPVLDIWARGGMGKTMHLRHLIARLCVPKPERIACARIDLDALPDVALATQKSWLLLIEIAAQLDRQIRDTPFEKLLRQYPDARAELWTQPRARDEGRAAARERNDDPDTAELVEDRFTGILADLDPSERVVIVLDTLERAIAAGDPTRDREILRPLLQMLARIQAAAPAVRFVFSGRDDLATRIGSDGDDTSPGFSELFPHATRLRLDGLLADEARAYLTRKRGVHDPDIVEAAVRAACGDEEKALPFKLALIADVHAAEPGLTADDILAYRSVDELYLIERVVERVEPGVQWLLRYGVVPRVLDRRFVDEVMPPHLAEGMSGKGSDQPARDGIARRRGDAPPRWPTDERHATEPLDLDDLWRRLKRYAGASSWVSVVSGMDDDVVRFHPDVVVPMRDILARQPVFAELQADAARFFERRAVAQPEDWARWTREAVFHRFQLDGPTAANYWEGRLGERPGMEGAADRWTLADDLLRSDYVDEDGRPRERVAGAPLIDDDTLTRARYEKAWATVQLAVAAHRPPDSARWDVAEELLKTVESAQRGRASPPVDPARIALARAPILLVRGRLQEAGELIREAVAGPIADEDRYWLQLANAETLRATEAEDPVASYEALLGELPRDGDPEDRERVRARLAKFLAERGELARALEVCEKGRREAEQGPGPRLLLAEGRLRLLTGEASAALDAARDAGRAAGVSPVTGARASLLAAEAHLALLRGQDAADAAAEAIGQASRARTEGDPRGARELARAVELQGVVCAERLDARGALKDLAQAAELWTEAGSSDDSCRCYVRRGAFQARQLGDVRAAGASVHQARRAVPSVGGEAWAACLLLDAELAARGGDGEHGRELVERVAARLRAEGAAPYRLVGVALGGLGLELPPPERERWATTLAEQLELITPARARLPLLAALRGCASLPPGPAAAVLRAAVPSMLDGPPPPFLPELDHAVMLLRDAELDRVVGRQDDAARKLRDARAALVDSSELAHWHWLGAVARADVPVEPPSRFELARLTTTETVPLLDAAVMILGAIVHPGTAGALLPIAQRLLAHERLTGRWSALLNEALSRLAAQQDEPEEARRRGLAAAETYGHLLDDGSRRRVLGRLGEEVDPPPEPDEPGTLIAVATSADGVRVQRRRDGIPIVGPDEALPVPDGAPLVDAIAEWASTPRDVPALFDELGAILLGPSGITALGLGGPPVDVPVRLHDLGLHPLPWELARVDAGPDRPWLTQHPLVHGLHRTALTRAPDLQDVRALQVALTTALGEDVVADGALGSHTRAALTRFQERIGHAPTGQVDADTHQALHEVLCPHASVTVVRADRPYDSKASNALSQAGPAAEELYASYGFQVSVVDPRDPEALERVLRIHPTTIVHLSVGFVASGASAMLDLGDPLAAQLDPASSGGPRHLTSTQLDLLLRGPLPKPAVILDPPAPRGVREVALQLRLRNTFAGDLFALGGTLGVLATGLARYRAQARLYDLLLPALARGMPLGEIATTIRREGGPAPGNAEHAMAFTAAALFARRADVRLPAAKP